LRSGKFNPPGPLLSPLFNRETAYRSRDASKGGAIKTLKELLGFERVICFGDSDNDLSMFETADEGYAPANANDAIKSAATAIIGHHDDEGIARFLRERFSLDVANG
jgi:hydroxymethylpyrimidine pyrophosphatase-like HAD family hydrolase